MPAPHLYARQRSRSRRAPSDHTPLRAGCRARPGALAFERERRDPRSCPAAHGLVASIGRSSRARQGAPGRKRGRRHLPGDREGGRRAFVRGSAEPHFARLPSPRCKAVAAIPGVPRHVPMRVPAHVLTWRRGAWRPRVSARRSTFSRGALFSRAPLCCSLRGRRKFRRALLSRAHSACARSRALHQEPDVLPHPVRSGNVPSSGAHRQVAHHHDYCTRVAPPRAARS